MDPINRISFTFPIYALDGLPGNRVVVGGGGGQMKSGIPNVCEVLSFDESNAGLASIASTQLSDAAVALATHGNVIHIVLGSGVKDYVYKSGKLVPSSSFEHDLQVSTTQEQTAVAASEDGSTLVVASDNGHVVVLSLERFEPVFNGRVHTSGVTDLSVTSDGSLVGTTGRDKAAQIWKSRDGEVLQTLDTVMPPSTRTHIRAIRFCSAQPDVIFTTESNPRRGGWIAAWRKSSASEITRYSPVAKIKASADALTALCVNNEGTLLASSSAEGHVSLFGWDRVSFSKRWSTESRTSILKAPAPPHVLPVTGMHFSSSGKYVLAASADYTISIWQVRQSSRWGKCTRLLFWVLTVLIPLLAILLAEDQHLNEVIRSRRAQIAPYMEPHLSEVQQIVRPFIRDQHRSLYSHFSKLGKTARIYFRDKSRKIPVMLMGMSRSFQRRAFVDSNETDDVGKTDAEGSSEYVPKTTPSSSTTITDRSRQNGLTASPAPTALEGAGPGRPSTEIMSSDASQVSVPSLDKVSPEEFKKGLLSPPVVPHNKEEKGEDSAETSGDQSGQHLEDSSGKPSEVSRSSDGFRDVRFSIDKPTMHRSSGV